MIRENILRIRERVASSCAKIGKPADPVTIIAVTKGRSLEQIEEAVSCGITNIGESRIQEAVLKYDAIRNTQYAIRLKWHLIGHLQTNKVKDAVKVFDLIHSVDSMRLAQEIDKEAARINKIQDILIQVNTSGEMSKFGLSPDAAFEAIREIGQLKNIKIDGLMTIAPLSDDPESARPCFRALRELRDKLNQLRTMDYGLWTLSMGMTDDYRVAIEEGSNMLRLGRAIFENTD